MGVSSGRDQDTFRLELSAYAAQAAHYALTSRKSKKRVESRLTRRCLTAMKRGGCMDMDAEDVFKGNFKVGTIDLQEDWVKHLEKRIDECYEADGQGLPGIYDEGMDEVLEQIEEARTEAHIKRKQAKQDKKESN